MPTLQPLGRRRAANGIDSGGRAAVAVAAQPRHDRRALAATAACGAAGDVAGASIVLDATAAAAAAATCSQSLKSGAVGASRHEVSHSDGDVGRAGLRAAVAVSCRGAAAAAAVSRRAETIKAAADSRRNVAAAAEPRAHGRIGAAG